MFVILIDVIQTSVLASNFEPIVSFVSVDYRVLFLLLSDIRCYAVVYCPMILSILLTSNILLHSNSKVKHIRPGKHLKLLEFRV